MKIILASASQRRIEMMNELGFEYEIIPSNADEFVSSFSSPEDLVKQLSKKKCESVFDNNKDAIVLGFDTLVFLDDMVLGKPQNEEECINMIESLQGRKHIVVTGACIKYKDYIENFASSCEVYFSNISKEEIINYAKTKEPYDKAGGYAVQGYIGRYIEKVNGDYFSVIGMPKAKVYKILKNLINGKD